MPMASFSVLRYLDAWERAADAGEVNGQTGNFVLIATTRMGNMVPRQLVR